MTVTIHKNSGASASAPIYRGQTISTGQSHFYFSETYLPTVVTNFTVSCDLSLTEDLLQVPQSKVRLPLTLNKLKPHSKRLKARQLCLERNGGKADSLVPKVPEIAF